MLGLGGVVDLLNGLAVGRVIKSEAEIWFLSDADATMDEVLALPW